MIICGTAEGMSDVSDSEVLVMFVIAGGEGTARNNSESHKIKSECWKIMSRTKSEIYD